MIQDATAIGINIRDGFVVFVAAYRAGSQNRFKQLTRK